MYHLLRIISSLISQLTETWAERLARSITWVTFDALRIRRPLMLQNLALAFPEKSKGELTHIARESVYHFVMTGIEFFRSGAHDITRGVTLEGDQALRSALKRQQGAYILCFHMGNWEAMAATMTRLIIPSYVLVKRVGTPGVDRFVNELRDKIGFLSVKRTKKGDGFKRIKEILGRGEVVGFVMDQARPGEPKLPFFNHPAKTNTSFAAIYQKCPAPIIPAFIVRHSIGQHTLKFFPEVNLLSTGDDAVDITNHSILFNKIIENYVRQYPEHYFWMHDRWK